MRTILSLNLCLLLTTALSQKEDFIWIVSHVCGIPEATKLDFNGSGLDVSVIDREMCAIGTDASICDKSGELLLYTNGVELYNRFDEIVENSDSLNFGFFANSTGSYGYSVQKGAFFLQYPGQDSVYYLFHVFAEIVNNTIPFSPRYSVIDLRLNNGQGKVTEKNVQMLAADDLVNYLHTTAVRHANGRDWWIIVPSKMGPEYFRFLLTPNGVEGPWVQEIGYRQETTNFLDNGYGMRVFSPDGTKFSDYDFQNFTQLFDFDRCTGLLGNARLIDHGIDTVHANAGASVTFSPSGRYLYLTRTNNGYSLYQYDTEASDVLASEVEIYHCPLVGQQWECGLLNMWSAPDGKIYIIGADNAWSQFSIIHQPDSMGLACDFELGGLQLPLYTVNAYTPYWPNYRLGALEGSACDTIVSDVATPVHEGKQIEISPNPATHSVQVKLPDGTPSAMLKLFTATGVPALTQRLTTGWNTVPLEGMAPGLYLYEVHDGGRRLGSGKLVKATE